MTISPCCNSPLVRMPSVPSEEVWVCARCGHRFLNETWADAESPDAKEIYHYHWAKIKTFAARGAPMPSKKLQCKIDGD